MLRLESRFSDISCSLVTFSPDSRELAYFAQASGMQLVVRDGVEGASYEGVFGALLYSPDSKHLLHAANQRGRQFMVHDGNACRAFDYIVIGGNEVFSRNSARVAYVAKQGDGQFVVVDDRTESAFAGIGAQSVTFSADSKRTMYIARIGDKRFVVCDGRTGNRYANVSCPAFTPDGKRAVCVAQLDRGHGLVIDQTGVYQCDGFVMIGGGCLRFDVDDTLRVAALIAGGLYSIEMKL